jgi:hypothetical protein
VTDGYPIATAAAPLDHGAEDPARVKVVCDDSGLALYFSRSRMAGPTGSTSGSTPTRTPRSRPSPRSRPRRSSARSASSSYAGCRPVIASGSCPCPLGRCRSTPRTTSNVPARGPDTGDRGGARAARRVEGANRAREAR